jgi:Dolichyl-phosphate-mannose-protein mannosyltransferase
VTVDRPDWKTSAVAREAACVAVIALATRLVYLDHTPHLDEFYHMLAARSWLEDGTFRIGDGAYTRSWLFTVLVAGFLRAFGDNLVAARLPAVLAGSLLVVVLFLWVRREAGRAAGWISAGLLCFDPGAIHLSQLARFYAPHSLLFVTGAAGTYALVERRVRGRRALGVGGLAALAFALALHLQVTTLIGLVAVGLWVAIRLAMPGTDTVRTAPRGRRLVGPLVIVAIAIAGVAAQTPLVRGLWAFYRSAPLWMRPWQDDVRWYHWWFADEYRALWCLLPLAVVMAAASRPRPTAFFAVVFGVAFVLHSFAAAKHTRFISYAMPFFAAIWAIALADAVPRMVARVREVVVLVPGGLARPVGGMVTIAAVGAILGFATYGTPAFTTALRLIAPAEGQRPFRASNWRAATPVLRQLAGSAEVVLSSAGPKSLYYLERLDVGLSAWQLADLTPGRPTPEFSVDYRTGRPLISSPESLRRIMECHRSGLVILERNHFSVEWHVPRPTTDYLVTHAQEVSVPEPWRLRVFRWQHATDCPRESATTSTQVVGSAGPQGRDAPG